MDFPTSNQSRNTEVPILFLTLNTLELLTWEPLTNIVGDFEHCGKFKAMVVTDRHLTKEPTETVYSGFVSLRNLRLAMFLSELNNLPLWGAIVGNAYLQALTKEKLYIVSGPEFEESQGYVLAMYKAPYGTTSGGEYWHDKSLDIPQQMDFLQPPLFWKGDTGELTAKTKGSDRIFTIKMGLSQSLLVQEGNSNLNVTLKGY